MIELKIIFTEYTVQLRGGSNKREGRVEVNLQSADWGTVCDDYFDINAADVICKFLGFPGAPAAYGWAYFGEGSGLIWLDNLNCAGSESTPFHCPHNGFGVHNCWHFEDAGVQCTCKSSKMNRIHCMKFKSTSVSDSQVLKCQVVMIN